LLLLKLGGVSPTYRILSQDTSGVYYASRKKVVVVVVMVCRLKAVVKVAIIPDQLCVYMDCSSKKGRSEEKMAEMIWVGMMMRWR
jgi:hypothetical protein